MDHTVRNGKADWENVPASTWTYWQRLAARTHGYATPGNAVTVGGALLSLDGLLEVYRGTLTLGLILLAVGRLADVVDGTTADLTQTKSPLGEALDASCDKAVVIIAIAVLLVRGYIPLPLLALILLHTTINVTTGLVVNFKHLPFHPSPAGKRSVAAEWFAIFWFMLADTIQIQSGPEIAGLQHILYVISLVLGCLGAVAFLVWGAQSSYAYVRMVLHKKPTS